MTGKQVLQVTGAALGVIGCAMAATVDHAPNALDELAPEGVWMPPLSLCFEPGTSPEVMAAAQEKYAAIAQANGMGARFFVGAPWLGVDHTPVVLAYSFAPDGIGLNGQGGGNNVLNAEMNSLFQNLGGEATWKALFAQSFARWAELTGNAYGEVPDDGVQWPFNDGPATSPGAPRGDLRIVMGILDNNVLAANFFPENGDMILDFGRNWNSQGSNFRFLRNVLMHEHGHGLGLAHSCPQTSSKLMEPAINLNFDGPQLDDIRGGQSLYGDFFEPATPDLEDFGFVEGAPFTLTDLSLHDTDDVDTYRFTATTPSSLSASVTPTGFSYPNAAQQGQSCPSGPTVNALSMQDLRLEVRDPSNQVIAFVDDNGLGAGETLPEMALMMSGPHRVIITSAGGTAGEPQMYDVTITFTDLSQVGDLNGDALVNSTDFAILLGSWGPCPAPPTPCIADLNGDGIVSSGDLAILLGNWTV